MFLSREEREARKEREQKIVELEEHIENLRDEYEKHYDRYKMVKEAYTQSQVPKWEYTQISDKSENCWNIMSRLGLAGWEMVGMATFAEGGSFKTIFTQYVLKRQVIDLPAETLTQFSEMYTLNEQIDRACAQIEALKKAR